MAIVIFEVKFCTRQFCSDIISQSQHEYIMTYNNSIDSELKLLNILAAVFIHQDEDPENLNQDSGGEIIELKCTPFLDQKTKKNPQNF